MAAAAIVCHSPLPSSFSESLYLLPLSTPRRTDIFEASPRTSKQRTQIVGCPPRRARERRSAVHFCHWIELVGAKYANTVAKLILTCSAGWIESSSSHDSESFSVGCKQLERWRKEDGILPVCSLAFLLPPPNRPPREGWKESNNAMPTLPCSADDKNEIRGSHIDNPDAEGRHK